MEKYEINMLLELLQRFFKEHDFNKRNFLFRNPVALLLKTELKKRGRWKNKGHANHDPTPLIEWETQNGLR